ncbi:MAG TPA: hypothetical protein VKW77_10395, partial [Acidimicrobiales bacterium]|nr:hypothetical protein [Acidimicrobiales bacterium]
MKGVGRGAAPRAVELVAPAKLTLWLRVVGVRADGYHLLEAEMVTLDLADSLHVAEADDAQVTVEWDDGSGDTRRGPGAAGGPPTASDDLVARALGAVGRRAHVRLVKRIPVGAGLGGGSADAAAILRWAGCHDRRVAASLGADVPFCVVGGRALVRG